MSAHASWSDPQPAASGSALAAPVDASIPTDGAAPADAAAPVGAATPAGTQAPVGPADPAGAPEPAGAATPTDPPAPADAPVPPARRSRRRRAARAVGLAGGAALLVAVTFTGGALADRSGLLGRAPAATATAAAGPVDPGQFAIVRQAWDLLRTQYVGAKDVDPTKMAYGAISGMTQVIDDRGHTGFMTPDGRKASQSALAGTIIGIGVQLDTRTSPPVISGLVPGGPSEAAGLLPGDSIVAVDGKPTRGETPDMITAGVRGAAGTTVTLTVARPGETTPREFRLVRAEIKVPPVDSAMIPGTTLGMIRIEQFSSGAGDEFAKQLKSLLAQHPTGLVLDLRGDPGGLVSEAVNVASQFLTSGEVYSTRDASGKETPVMVKPGALAPAMPLVVLVDDGTASSAEVLAGALQDAGRAKVIGTTTFGTGTVVAEYPLADGSALRIGTIEWLTPKHDAVWRHGITPTVTVDLADGVRPLTPRSLSALGAGGVAATKDVQLQTAIELLGSKA